MELGELKKQNGKRFSNGEFSILLEMSDWRFSKGNNLIVGSSDDFSKIDKSFRSIKISKLIELTIDPILFDINMIFEDGVRFKSFISSSDKDKYRPWIIYLRRDGGSWGFNSFGTLRFEE